MFTVCIGRTRIHLPHVLWLSALLCLLLAAPALSSPTGLNNIPTSDVVPEGVLVLQQFTNSGSSQATVFAGGLKYGLRRDLEIGLDIRAGVIQAQRSGAGVAGAGGAPGSSTPVIQMNYRLFNTRQGFAGGIGLANLSTNTAKAGKQVEYLALSQSFGRPRLHAGYLYQGSADALFFGADMPVSEKTILRADWIETNNGRDHLSSLGFISQCTPQFLVEGWVSFPSAQGVHDTFTLKFDYVIPE